MTELTVWHDDGLPALPGRDRGDAHARRRDLLARFHASKRGELLSGAAAFEAMWHAIPRLRPLGLLARSPMVLRLLETASRQRLMKPYDVKRGFLVLSADDIRAAGMITLDATGKHFRRPQFGAVDPILDTQTALCTSQNPPLVHNQILAWNEPKAAWRLTYTGVGMLT